MADTNLTYLGAADEPHAARPAKRSWRKRLPLGFLIVVGIPTLVSGIYYGLIASPRYVSESHFVVRSASSNQPTGLGIALQGVGISSGMNDAFAVHEYMASRDSVKALQSRFNLKAMLDGSKIDWFSRSPRPWEGKSEEALYKGFKRFLTVGYDATSGISTVRVEAFTAKDAQAINAAMLDSGEALINRLNERSAANAVRDARVSYEQARGELAASQQALTALRNSAQFIDPRAAVTESTGVISGLLVTIAQLRADRAQLASEAPSSPQLPVLDSRIAAYERQVEEARAKVTGGASSLAPKVGVYEELTMRREIADKVMAQATAALLTAEQDARRQKLYLERIVAPSEPDKPTEPKRWLALLTIFASSLLVYAVGWLVWAGVREHRQD
ncbi:MULTISPECIES: chain-length determining protein [unclassified Brevundimonas]|uniref:chain-length determining protein n=1 Tax=unclassified Brevundimonas TaxID=2622653 RepID=UPI003F933A1F